MQWLRRMMYGRYGADMLGVVLLVVGLVLSLIGQIGRWWWLMLLAYVPMVICIWRMFSKNIYKRQRENAKLMAAVYKVKNFFITRKTRFAQRKIYKYFRCPQCKLQLRAPRGRGKIRVTCQKCKTQFITKT